MKNSYIFRIIVFVIIALLLTGFIFWKIQKKRPVNIFVLDKTVPDYKYSEHKSLFWVLNYNRYTKPNGEAYSYRNDYYGFHPQRLKSPKEYTIKGLRLYEVLSVPDDLDMMYITDTYGLTYEDWFHRPPDRIHSNLLYGGLNQNDYLLLSEMRRKNKLIVTEFNMLASPTSDLIRSKTETLFDFYWSGWTGCYFSSLNRNNKALPRWIISFYENKQHKTWDFSGKGIILVHEKGKIVVLEDKKHLSGPVPVIVATPDAAAEYHIPLRQNYSFWFDIVDPGKTNATLASYHLNLTGEGKKLFQSLNLPAEFPAVIEHLHQYKFYYFAGDFSDRNLVYGTSFIKGIPSAARFFSLKASNSKTTFFWKFYLPLVENIIKKHLKN